MQLYIEFQFQALAGSLAIWLLRLEILLWTIEAPTFQAEIIYSRWPAALLAVRVGLVSVVIVAAELV